MALQSMDDKLVGEKSHNYCSSDEEVEENYFEANACQVPTSDYVLSPSRDGKAIQTGPKGVIEDWRRFKQLEIKKRAMQTKEKEELCQRLLMTCQSFNEEKDSADDSDDDQQFMEWYKQKRITEIQQKYASRWAKISFGHVIELSRSDFVEAIEGEKSFVTVIIHIYSDENPACTAVNGCMEVLAAKYSAIKFCRMHVNEAEMSRNFLENGLPTIIVYKGNLVIGNFVSIGDTLGEDFFAADLEEFLTEYGILPSKHEIS